VKKMKAEAQIQLQFARDRRANDLQAAANARLVERSASPSARQSVRRAIGVRIIAVGARLAADAPIQPARFR
jgi:hypothetical protein